MTTPATRIDSVTGIREEVGYFGARSPLMFGTTHLPAREARAGVIICGSVHAELRASYRKEVLLGRALAAAGVAVQRFHYRGAGHSEGDVSEVSLDAMTEAVAEARRHLARHVEVERVGYVGTRLGCFPATAAAAEAPGSPLVLWSPILETATFMREVFRSHYIAALKGERKPEPTARMIERIRQEGWIEAIGYVFTDRFYSSLEGQRLETLSPKDCPVLLVPFGPSNYEGLTEAWTKKGADVHEFLGSSEEAWWLESIAVEAEDGQEGTKTLVTGTAQWLVARLLGDRG